MDTKSDTPAANEAEDKAYLQPEMIVGIGASAGGLEALQAFFTSCPSDLNVAYVIVQHLSPDFKSLMDQLLERCTEMEVTFAEHNEVVEANKVYLIPTQKSMIVADGKLLLSDTIPHASLSLPIDTFFRSLAKDMEQRSIAVVLSGTGSDGSRGIASIKEAGGLVIVQDPAEAKFDGMPNAAKHSGYVDHIMEVDLIPQAISGYLRSYSALAATGHLESADETTHKLLKMICAVIQKHTSINLEDYKPSTIGRRIDKRASLHNLSSWESYYDFLLENPKEQEILGKEILIGVTRFFRDSEVWNVLREKVIPEIIEAVDDKHEIRVWCTGCSSGEEAYSLAISFDEVLEELGVERKIKIFATDIDANAVSEAGAGIYSSQIEDDVSAERLSRYFTRLDNGSYQISARIRKWTVFAIQNLVTDPPILQYAPGNMPKSANLFAPG